MVGTSYLLLLNATMPPQKREFDRLLFPSISGVRAARYGMHINILISHVIDDKKSGKWRVGQLMIDDR